MLRTKIHIVISAIGALLGLSAFVCFCIVYANIEAGMWALMSGKFFSNTCLERYKEIIAQVVGGRLRRQEPFH